jgi:hypothetical protein
MSFLQVRPVIATFEVEPIVLADDSYGSLKFRIEIIVDRERNIFSPIIYRWETLRVQSTFPQDDGEPTNDLSDHEILVKDFGIECDELLGKSMEEVLEKTISKIKLIFMID